MTAVAAINRAESARVEPGSLANRNLLCCLLLVGIVVLAICFARPEVLFRRPLWFDEYLTSVLVGAPTTSKMLYALAHGIDNNAPGYFLLARAMAAGSADLVFRLRAISFLFGILTLVGTFFCIKAFAGHFEALAGALMLWASPLFIEQVFEARYYATLAASTIWLVALLVRPWTVTRVVAATLLASILCSIHFLAVGIFGPIFLTSLLLRRHIVGFSWVKLAAISAGPACVTLLNLFLMRLQFQGITVKSWVGDPAPSFVLEFISDFFAPIPIGFILLFLAATHIFSPPRRVASRLDPKSIFPVSLVCFPFLLVAISLTYQSVLVPRYFVPALVGISASAAICLSQYQPHWSAKASLLLVLSLLGGAQLRIYANGKAFWQADYLKQVKVLDDLASAGPLMVTTGRSDAYAVHATRPDLTPRVAVLCLDDVKNIPRALANDTEFARKASGVMGMPRAVSLNDLFKTGPVHAQLDAAALDLLRRYSQVQAIGPDFYQFSPLAVH